MTEKPVTEDLSPPPGSTPSEMFPVLTSAQQARVLPHGQHRTVEQGEIVVELNEHVTKVFVVASGQLHVLQVSNNQEHVIPLLSDPDHKIIDAYGLLDPAYEGQRVYGIPHPALYMIDKQSKVAWTRIESDYKQRPTNEEIRAALDSLK